MCCGKRLMQIIPRWHPLVASMRPQLCAAENFQAGLVIHRHRCFNEAAAMCCGKPGLRYPHSAWRRGFNEAAAMCCGKQSIEGNQNDRDHGFNEAAAMCCGKR